jgi:hypothetical protein
VSLSVQKQILQDSIHSIGVIVRKTSLQNKTDHQQSKLLTLSSRAQYSKPLINSFRVNLSIRNHSSKMNIQGNELNSAQQTASTEASAADAANDLVVNSEGDASETDSLIDYNDEVDETAAEAEKKAAEQKALREMLANNGLALRDILKTERVRSHYTSPFARKNTMSPEEIFSEMPKEDLHEVGVVQNRIFIPASFVQKWLIPTIRARNALKSDGGNKLPGGIETAILFSIFDQSILDLTKSRQQLDEGAYAIRAIVACAQDANLNLIEKMKRGNDGLHKIANASLKQLEQVFLLPPHGDLYNMSSIDYTFYQDRISDAIKQYRAHTARDLDDLQMLREQIALQASLICLGTADANLQNERSISSTL